MERLLGTHPDVASGGELPDLQHELAWQLDSVREFPIPLATCCPDEKGLAGLSQGYWNRTLDIHGGRLRLIDKQPKNVWASPVIIAAMGSARIVCMTRDGMDACFSNMKEMFPGEAYRYSYDQLDVSEHHANFMRVARHWQKAMPGNFKLVRYEDLVSNPQETLQDVMRFCDLRPAELDNTLNHAPMISASNTQARRAINSDSVGAWRRYEKWLRPLQDDVESRAVRSLQGQRV